MVLSECERRVGTQHYKGNGMDQDDKLIVCGGIAFIFVFSVLTLVAMALEHRHELQMIDRGYVKQGQKLVKQQIEEPQ